MNTNSTTPADLGVPVRDFNHHTDPGVRIDPLAAFDRFRDERVFWTPELDGFWVLTRYADIRAVLRDTETFSNQSTAIPPIDWSRRLIPVELDPPDHSKYRTLLTRYLNGPAGTAIAAAVEQECARLVERLAPAGKCDLVADFARPLQNALLNGLFDVPDDERPDFAQLAADLVQASEPARRGRAVRDILSFVEQAVTGHSTGERSDDGGSLVDFLARAEVDGRPLSHDETLTMAFLMVMASIETLTSSISFTFRYLAEHPEHQRRLATDAGSAAGAADELLRLHSIVSISRVVKRDTEVAGVQMRAGERILVCLSLAGRDPDQYPEPAIADFDRPNRASHFAFGFGVHRCVGARIATVGLTAALRDWHAAVPEYSVPQGTELVTGGGAACSLQSLPLTWKA